jgi:hypothetical protein
MPRLHAPAEGEPRENERQQQRHDLSGDHDPAPICTIGDGSTDWRQDENRDLAAECRYAQQRRGARQAIDQPRLRDRLHPRSDQRDELAAEEELIVAMPKRAQKVGHDNEARLLASPSNQYGRQRRARVVCKLRRPEEHEDITALPFVGLVPSWYTG